jgi:hypothetical protein
MSHLNVHGNPEVISESVVVRSCVVKNFTLLASVRNNVFPMIPFYKLEIKLHRAGLLHSVRT